MRVSVGWLEELVGIDGRAPEALARILTARGLTVDAIEAAGDDTVLDLDVPANRPDCLGHLGVAREIAAATGAPLRAREAAAAGSGEAVERAVSVRIEAEDLCGRYTAGIVRGVTIGPSPAWAVARLTACGLRSVHNVVDASNLVLLETGQPIHTFDLDRVAKGAIRVRRAAAGERLTTLDGVERRLEDGMLVIAGEEEAIALGGIIGGAATEIGNGTRNVLVEAASFAPLGVRRTAKRLGLSTDASQRFERGVDPEAVVGAQRLAASLLSSLAGGVAAPGMLDVRPARPVTRTLSVRRERVERLLGFDPGEAAMREALAALFLSPEALPGDSFRVTVPSWRVDLEREADLVEEIGRHLGYDRIPSRRPAAASIPAPSPVRVVEDRTRDLLADLGFHEATSYSMGAAVDDAPFVAEDAGGAVAIVNPIAEGLSHLRRSLVPGLLRALDLNLRRGARDVRLFEVGRVFASRGGGAFPDEPHHVGVAWTGAAVPRHYDEPSREASLADVAGLGETLLRVLRPALRVEHAAVARGGLHPGRSLSFRSGAELLGIAGEIHPALRKSLDLGAPAFVLEMDLDAIAAVASPPIAYRPVPRFPSVSRDLSLVVSDGVAFSAMIRVLEDVPAPAPAAFELLDRYEGPPLEAGHVSMTVRVILRPAERTLTDAETEAYRSRLVAALEKALPVKLRT
jgi:phenylalanyl-tRNA synthetase beta chain